uniref:Uncharacterized protein n=1 Tax=Neogobius melanostomus TaxID=47308 RepID=A0A8C6T4E6_9GOBI
PPVCVDCVNDLLCVIVLNLVVTSCSRFQKLQMFCCHLQDVLRDHAPLRQRLLRPHGRTHLPVPATCIGKFVVEVMQMFLDFIETLEQKISSERSRPSAPERLAQMVSITQTLRILTVNKTVCV